MLAVMVWPAVLIFTPSRKRTIHGDGSTEIAAFPGDLPDESGALADSDAFRGLSAGPAREADYRFLRFRPPPLEPTGSGSVALPHIRLDRALQFLLGDYLT